MTIEDRPTTERHAFHGQGYPAGPRKGTAFLSARIRRAGEGRTLDFLSDRVHQSEVGKYPHPIRLECVDGVPPMSALIGRGDQHQQMLAPTEAIPGLSAEASVVETEDQDPLFDEAVTIVTESRRASISGVQRRLKIGYNRAARLVEEMERIGVVSSADERGNRDVLAPPPVKD